MNSSVAHDAFATRLAPPGECISNVGASLLAKASTHYLGFFDIRNDLALASTIRYITSVINNGNRK